MDPIRQALELARSRNSAVQGNSDPFAPFPPSAGSQEMEFREVKLSAAHLETTRIVAHDALYESGRYYDMLRTLVLQAMDEHGWQILAITSPTAGCGKSVTACNLAMSIARLPERNVLLVDMDLQKPKVAEYLGIDAKSGLLSVLQGRIGLSSAIVRTSIAQNRMLVLPGEVCKSGSAEWMASQAMATSLQALKTGFPVACDHSGHAARTHRRRRNIGLASDRIDLAGDKHWCLDLARHQGVPKAHQIHPDRSRRRQQSVREE